MSNSIWKTSDQKPDGEDTYIAITTDGLICDFVSPKMCDNSVDKWAYLTDLIAQADKAERLQEGLEDIKNQLEYRACLECKHCNQQLNAIEILKDVEQLIKETTDDNN